MKKSPRQASGVAVLVGVNKLDPGHFGTSCVDLLSPDKDVEDYELIAKLSGLATHILIAENATKPKLLNALSQTAKSLKAGDFFVLTFSGHGGLITNFDSEESHPVSPTWCLFNGQILLSEIYQALAAFPEGVNILVVSDSSSMMTGLDLQAIPEHPTPDRQRALPVEIAETVYLKNKDHYDAQFLVTKANPNILANVIWIDACQLNQVAHETNYNGYLTAAIKHVWNGGAFSGDYELFAKEVTLALPAFQSPKVTVIGEGRTVQLARKPFAI